MDKLILTRKDLCDIFHISRTHLCRLIKKHNLKPIEENRTVLTKKYLYRIEDVEEAFNIKLRDMDNTKEGSYKSKDLIDGINDILNEN